FTSRPTHQVLHSFPTRRSSDLCILYEAVTGHKAFEGKDAIDTLNKIIREPCAPITDFRPEPPHHLQRIVRRCLAKDPEDRYQTIDRKSTRLNSSHVAISYAVFC